MSLGQPAVGSTGVGAAVGSGVGVTVGSGVAVGSGVGAAVGSGVAVGSLLGSGVGSGVAVGSVVGSGVVSAAGVVVALSFRAVLSPGASSRWTHAMRWLAAPSSVMESLAPAAQAAVLLFVA